MFSIKLLRRVAVASLNFPSGIQLSAVLDPSTTEANTDLDSLAKTLPSSTPH